jgi:ABC-type oligopeptide transport system substrate-binding subunit
VSVDLHDPISAKSAARQVKKDLGEVVLTLKYPDDDPRVAKACQAIADQVQQMAAAAECRVQLKTTPLSPQNLRSALHNHDFELAYTCFDFDNDLFWLWPYFDSHRGALQPGGSNFLGYENDAKLATLLREMMTKRQFSALQECAHNIHAHLYERMPFIPLWQIPKRILVHRDLITGPLDLDHIFANVTEWKLPAAESR